MIDEELKQYIPKVGDRYAAKQFSNSYQNKQQKETRKMSLLNKLRSKLGQKRAFCSQSDSDEDTSSRSAKLKGNVNDRKEQRKIEIGWCGFNERFQR